MNPDENPSTDTAPADTPDQQPAADQTQAPVDALSLTPEELEKDRAEQAAASAQPKPVEKKVSPVKRFFRRVNLYFLIFLLVVVVAVAITAVNYLNSKKTAPEATIATQDLTEDALKQLANTDASVGSADQTLSIQGNAIISGETLARGNMNVAGNLQAGGKLQAPSLTVSGETNLASTQINTLQVAQNTAVQGSTTLRDLNVSGSSSFSGALTASQITVSKLVLSGNAVLQIPNHISFTGPSPSRSINTGVLGGGGSASVNGSDTTGTVNINTGNNPSPGCFARVNFRQNFSNQPHVIITPVGAAAGKTQHYVSRDKAGFSVCTSNSAPSNKSFAFDYFVTN